MKISLDCKSRLRRGMFPFASSGNSRSEQFDVEVFIDDVDLMTFLSTALAEGPFSTALPAEGHCFDGPF